MKKFLLYILLVVSMLFVLSGCDETTNVDVDKPEDGPKFVTVERYTIDDTYLGGTILIIVDTDTRIMYMLVEQGLGDGRRLAMSVVYDYKGEPKRYIGDLSSYENG